MRVLCLSVLLAVVTAESEGNPSPPVASRPSTSEVEPGSTGKPILSTDLFHRTAELFYDVYDSVHGKFLKPHLDKHADTVSKSVASLTEVDVVGEACNVLKCDAKEVNQHVRTISSTAQGHAKDAYSAVLAVLAQVEEALTRYTHFVIDVFETALPKYTGLINRTPMNLLLFVSYIFFVMYVILKIFLFSLWLGLTILSCLCCCSCRCLRGKKGVQVVDAAKNGKTSKAAEKGKAATNAPNNKPQAKAKK